MIHVVIAGIITLELAVRDVVVGTGGKGSGMVVLRGPQAEAQISPDEVEELMSRLIPAVREARGC